MNCTCTHHCDTAMTIAKDPRCPMHGDDLGYVRMWQAVVSGAIQLEEPKLTDKVETWRDRKPLL